MHEDRTFPGAVVASLCVPWGNANDSSGGYHLVWTRDAVETGLAFLAIGQQDDAKRLLNYLMATQQLDGSWPQNMFPDGLSFWTGVQLDETAFPVLFAAKLAESGLPVAGVPPMVRRAIAFIANNGPVSPQDRWEENPGLSPFTLGAQIVALVGGADHLAPEERSYALSLADYWNARIEDWTYVVGGSLSTKHGVDGYYVRLGPSFAQGGLKGRVNVANTAGASLAADALVGMEYLYLARFGLRDRRRSAHPQYPEGDGGDAAGGDTIGRRLLSLQCGRLRRAC